MLLKIFLTIISFVKLKILSYAIIETNISQEVFMEGGLYVTQDQVNAVTNRIQSTGLRPNLRYIRKELSYCSIPVLLNLLQIRNADKETVKYNFTKIEIDAGDIFIANQLLINAMDSVCDFTVQIHTKDYVEGVFSDEQKESMFNIGRFQEEGIKHNYYSPSLYREIVAEIAYWSAHLNGVSCSLENVRNLFENNDKNGINDVDLCELLNNKYALEYILNNVSDMEISRRDVINTRSLLLDNKKRSTLNAKKIQIKEFNGIQMNTDLSTVFSLIIDEFDGILLTASEISDPFEQSLYLLVNIQKIQPFSEINIVLARVIANIPLFKFGLYPLSFFGANLQKINNAIDTAKKENSYKEVAELYFNYYVKSAERLRNVNDN